MNSSENSTKASPEVTTGQSSSPLLILASSSTWQSALKRTNFRCPTVWALDENDLVAEAIRYPNAAAVIELSVARSDHFCKLSPLFWPARGIFVVGAPQIRSAENALRSLGIAELFYAPADLKRLVRMIERHNQTQSHREPAETLEQKIERELPWS